MFLITVTDKLISAFEEIRKPDTGKNEGKKELHKGRKNGRENHAG